MQEPLLAAEALWTVVRCFSFPERFPAPSDLGPNSALGRARGGERVAPAPPGQQTLGLGR
jgi:hypothetical protein